MRENRTYGSEGGEGSHSFPTPIWQKWIPTCVGMTMSVVR